MEHDYSPDRQNAERLALGLGWFSIGLGLVEVAAPRSLARAIGIPDASPSVLRAFGVRELGAGLAILAEPDRADWLWSRVGGDAVDLSCLAIGLNENSNKRRFAMALAAFAGVTALDVLCARQLQESGRRPAADRAVRVDRVTTINRPIHEVYDFWRRFENFPKFMRHLESVEVMPNGRSRWRAKAPAGMTVEWEAELIEERQDESIAWRSVPGSGIDNSGTSPFLRRTGRARHRSPRPAPVQPARRHAGSRHRLALRGGARSADPR